MKQISYEEFEAIFFKAQEGDSKSKLDYLNQIEGLIINSIRKYYPKYKDYEDLLQDGKVYALELLNLYESNNSSPPLGFIKTYLRYFYLDKYKHKTELLTLDQTQTDSEDNKTLKDIIPDPGMDPSEIAISGEMANKFLDAIDSLPFDQKDLIYRYFFENQSAKFIAQKYKITLRTFYYKKEKSIENLRGRVDHELLRTIDQLNYFIK